MSEHGRKPIQRTSDRTRRLGGLASLVLLAALAPAAVASGDGESSATGAATGELLRVLSPRDEGFVRGRSVTVRLRLASGASLRSAKLNGVGVRRRLRRGTSARVLVGSFDRARTGGTLRRGRNSLRLIVRRGKAREYRNVTFTQVRFSRNLVRRFRVGYSRRHGLGVSLRFSKPHVRVHAQLNGRNVSNLLADPRSTRISTTLGAGAGLRHGRNVLRLRVTHFHGEIRRLRRVVSVPRGVTIAGAGTDRRFDRPRPVRLDGGSSRPALRRGGGPAAGGLRYRWKVVESPPGSSPVLSDPAARRPTLVADLPGHYRVRLATSMPSNGPRDPATTTRDTVRETFEPQPFAAVDTLATAGGKDGIAVAVTRDCEGEAAAPPCFFPNESAGGLQVLVLDRETLEREFSASYSTGELAGFAAKMRSFISNPGGSGTPPEYEEDKLVIVALRSGTVSDAANLASGLAVFNVNSENEAEPLEGLAGVGPFSLIATPGTLEGKAALNYGSVQIQAPDGSKGAPGALVGVLKKISDEPGARSPQIARGFDWPDAIPFDTRAEEGKALKIGAESAPIVPAGTPAGADGLAVFTFDPVNPAGSLARAAFVTNSAGQGTNTGLAWNTLASALKRAREAKLGVAVVSSGDIGRFATEPQASGFIPAQQQLAHLKVNPDILGRAVAANGTYSMISAGARPEAPENVPGALRTGYSASSVLAEGVPEGGRKLAVGPGRLTGTLQRTTYGALFPAAGDPSGTAPEAEMQQIVLRRQTPWLLTPPPGATTATCQQTAFAYVATQISGLFEEPPVLWEGSDASACEGVDHTGATGPRRADNLDGDSCATTEHTATGAGGEAVRAASMTLRDSYITSDTKRPTHLLGSHA